MFRVNPNCQPLLVTHEILLALHFVFNRFRLVLRDREVARLQTTFVQSFQVLVHRAVVDKVCRG